MKKIIFVCMALFPLISCRYLGEFIADKKSEEMQGRDTGAHVRNEFQKFSTAVCKHNTEEYERFISTDEMLSNVKEKFKRKGKSSEEATQVFRAQYTKLFMELDKGAESKYCKMTIEPKVFKRFDRDTTEVNEITARFADQTHRVFSIARTSSDSYSIHDGILDIE